MYIPNASKDPFENMSCCTEFTHTAEGTTDSTKAAAVTVSCQLPHPTYTALQRERDNPWKLPTDKNGEDKL